MAFINVIVHSPENLNFRVHLQHEFTMLGLDEHLEVQNICVHFGYYISALQLNHVSYDFIL